MAKDPVQRNWGFFLPLYYSYSLLKGLSLSSRYDYVFQTRVASRDPILDCLEKHVPMYTMYWYEDSSQVFYSVRLNSFWRHKPSPFTMPINETPINLSKTGQKIVAFSLLFFSVI